MTIYSANQRNSDSPGVAPGRGSKDGVGSADNDQPYTFGRRPRAAAPFPFQTAQFARLLALRGRVHDGLYAADDLSASAVTLVFEPIVDEAA
jgi:hypothetical protein